ncbi:MAG TPA: hypothetical protein VL172_12235 [Kofleriaceae bacterium]|nr:hypothetical protein [Kofleriaceae bacterium]
MRRTLMSLVLVMVGCTSGGDSAGIDAGGGPDAAGGDCGISEYVCLPVPERGFQVASVGLMIEPQEDVEYCEIVQLPGTADDTYYVNRFESKMTTGSHHLIVSAVVEGSPTETNAHVGDRVPCVGPGGFGDDLREVTGSQHPYNEETFPDGVGRVYQGGQLVVFDYHYLNTSDQAIPAQAAVNFHTTDAANVVNIARDFGFYNVNIPTPMGQYSSFDASCAFDHDVTVWKLTRHTHQWGIDFTVWWNGGPNDGQQIYVSPDYEDTNYYFAEPLVVPAGVGFTWRCEYYNDSDHDLQFGPNATDEMCILFGVWWSPDGGDVPDQGCYRF